MASSLWATRARPRDGFLSSLPACFLLVCAITCSQSAKAAQADCPRPADCHCSQVTSFYEVNRFRIKSVRIDSPLSIIASVRTHLTAIKSSLPIKEGEEFTQSDYVLAQDMLRATFGALNPGERVRLVYIIPSIVACDAGASPPTLEVVYSVYTTEGISYATSIFERNPDKITRSLAPGPLSNRANKLLPQPYLGYDASRRLFAGTRATFQSTGGVFNRVEVDFSGSRTSATGGVGISGSRDFKSPALGYAEWSLGYQYSNIPADPIRIKEGTVYGQFFGATRPIGDRGMIVRFGGSIEGGNRQTNLPEAPTPESELERAPHGAIKMYVGSTRNWGRQAWTASYGLQIGQAGTETGVDYLKHVLDSAYSVRLMRRDHLPFRLDAQFGAGWIQAPSGRTPVAERFFGGNAQEDFIEGANWRIRSSPLIRSFPRNRLNLIGAGLPIGGKNFFSVNMTIAQTVWSRPAVPLEVLQDPQVRLALGGQIAGASQGAILSYLVETREFESMARKLDDIEAALMQLQGDFDRLKALNPPGEVLDSISEVESDISDARDAIKDLKGSPSMGGFRQLAVGFEGVAESQIENITDEVKELLEPLVGAGLAAERQGLDKDIKRLESIRSEVQRDFETVRSLAAINPKELEAPIAKLKEIFPILDRIESQLPDSLPGASQQTAATLNIVRAFAKAARNVANSAINNQKGAKSDLGLLVEGFKGAAPALMTSLADGVAGLKKPLAAAGAAERWQALEGEVRALEKLQAEIKARLQKIPEPDVMRKARSDIDYTGRFLDVVFRELNLIAFSPVVMLDAARIGPRASEGFGGTRYAIGTGVRFSLVTLDVTMGYCWNPKRRPGEGGGAFVFSMDIADLFR